VRATRVLGPEHPDTIKIKKKYLLVVQLFSPRMKDGQKYIVETQTGKLKVLPRQLIFAKHTPVSLSNRGETFTEFIDSFLDEVDKYRIFMYSGGVMDENLHCYDDVRRYFVCVFFTNLSEQEIVDMLQ
jgi:hypothetical protein